MSGPLVDHESYPRTDIDVYTIRHARHEVICLQNDHKAIMAEIEKGLHEVHAQARLVAGNDDSVVPTGKKQTKTLAFAVIDRVDPGSPAALAGLQVGDCLLVFGSVTRDNFQGLQSIGDVVQHSRDRPLSITIQRDDEDLTLSLTPRSWSGRGLLGCNIVPVDEDH